MRCKTATWLISNSTSRNKRADLVRRTFLVWSDGQVICPIDVAETRAERRRGLLGQSTIERPLWFPRTRSVHTVAMKVPIDVVWVSATGEVLDIRTMPPTRVALPKWSADSLFEMSAGGVDRLGLAVGQRVMLR